MHKYKRPESDLSEYSPRFDGCGSELLGIYLTNVLFSVLTLGIYYFWAKVRMNRYFYQHTEFFGSRFEYHATGKERLIGFFKGIALIFALILAIGAFSWTLAGTFSNFTEPGAAKKAAEGIAGLVLMLIFFLAGPVLVVGRERYRLGRSSLKNIRFRFAGSPWTYARIVFVGVLASLLTFGLALPYFRYQMKKFFVESTRYGNQAFSFESRLKDFYLLYLKGVVLTVLTFGIYFFWWRAAIHNHIWAHTSFQGRRFGSQLRGLTYLKVSLLSALLVIFTLGLGYPWAAVMRRRMLLQSITYPMEPDFAEIRGELDRNATALADGVAEAAEVLDSIADILS